MATATLKEVQNFLDLKRLAFVGISRNPQDFSRGLYKDLQQRGYDLVPVNPNVQEIDGKPCFKQVQDIYPPVEGVIIMTPPEVTEQVVQDCARAGIKHIWLHRGGGVGAVSEKALEYCQQNDIEAVAGYCPYMFLPETAFFHRIHGFGLKLTGKYPGK